MTERSRDAAIDIRDIRAIGHPEAMRLAETESERFLDLVRQLEDDDWRRPTDCTEWSVKDIVVHQLGEAAAIGSIREMVHQLRAARRLPTTMARVDRLNAVHVRERRHLATDQLPDLLAPALGRALRARRRAPALIRKIRFSADNFGRVSFGYMNDVVVTRDSFVHRVDISRATGKPMAVTADHEGRLIADVVRDWAAHHGSAFTLRLSGPAGGVYRSGSGGEEIALDALEFCRILSGRAPGTGLLTTQLPF
ncbi:MAG TPA: maleylpyruvate isomerase family mycothiol-dependent enzyme [Candidatus Dormibacteraeota bacterium]|nr:maleylpyruvate isomerase family mycothiol-dependent enzyme [Candidatus Dormibacteraeota bacterium]